MALKYSTTHRNNAMADITADAGTTAYLLIYDNSAAAPASCAAAATGVLLVSLPMSNPIAAAPASGVLTMSAITSTNTVAAGTAAYWRICTSSAGTTCVAQGTVGTSGADLNFAGGVAWTNGETISISSMTITAFGA